MKIEKDATGYRVVASTSTQEEELADLVGQYVTVTKAGCFPTTDSPSPGLDHSKARAS